MTMRGWYPTLKLIHFSSPYPTSLTSSWAAYHTSRRAESNLLPSGSMACCPSLFAEEASCPRVYAMSLLWCYSSTCTTCKPRSNSCDLCQSASVDKVEMTTMAHAQSAWRGQICFTSLWTAHGDGLLQSPGPLGGREGIGWVEYLQELEFATPGIAHSFPKASHVTWTRHAIS